MEILDTLALIFVVAFWVIVPPIIWVFVNREKKAFQVYLRSLDPKEQDYLNKRYLPLEYKFNLKLHQTFYRGSAGRLQVTGDQGILDMLYQYGKFGENYWPTLKGGFTLDGKQGKITWELSNRRILPWAQPVADVWNALGRLKDRIIQDPNRIFLEDHRGIEPKILLDQWWKEIDTAKITDKVVVQYLNSLMANEALTAAMLLRPPGPLWQVDHGLEALETIPASRLGAVLHSIGKEALLQRKKRFWEKFLMLTPGREAQKVALQYLEEVPELIDQAQLMTEVLFTSSTTKKTALSLLARYPNQLTLSFLQSLPQDQHILRAVMKIREVLRGQSGTLSFSTDPQESGALSTEQHDVNNQDSDNRDSDAHSEDGE